MKKKLMIFAGFLVGVAVLTLGGALFFHSLDETNGEAKATMPSMDDEKRINEAAALVTNEPVAPLSAHIISSEEWHLDGIYPSSSEGAIISVMHSMTHQKVKAEEKWGAIPITTDTIEKVKILVLGSDFKNKSKMLEMIGRWEKGNFDKIDNDHNYLWTVERGNMGRAYGIATEEEEKEFIINNFGEKYLHPGMK